MVHRDTVRAGAGAALAFPARLVRSTAVLGSATLPAHEEGGHEATEPSLSDSKLPFVRPMAPSYGKTR